MGRLPLTAAFLAATFIAGADSALGDGIAISPTTVAIDVAHRIATVTIANHDPVLYTFQITPYSWSQIDGQDKLAPTTDLLVSPPIFTLTAEGQQIVRFALRNPAPVANELTFRILLRTTPSDAAPPSSELQMRVGFSIPVFIASPQGGEPKLTCGYRDIGHNRIEFTIQNSGTAHVHVVHVRLADVHGASVDAPVAQYVLAGSTATIRLSASRPVIGETIDAKVTLDQGPPVDIVVHRDG